MSPIKVIDDIELIRTQIDVEMVGADIIMKKRKKRIEEACLKSNPNAVHH